MASTPSGPVTDTFIAFPFTFTDVIGSGCVTSLVTVPPNEPSARFSIFAVTEIGFPCAVICSE